MICQWKKGAYSISTDKRLLQIKAIHGFLANAYWSPGVSAARVRKSIRHSICFGMYHKGRQMGFARVISDYATFAYLADVFILPEHRGKGLSKWMMKCILSHPGLKSLRRFLLATRDAHGLYAQFGFTPLQEPQRFMVKLYPAK